MDKSHGSSAGSMTAVRRIGIGRAQVTSVPIPTPAEGEVLVQIQHAAVNPFDLQVLRGDFGGGDDELTLGAEAIGVLDGNSVLVSGQGLGAKRDGTFAAWVAAPKSAVMPLPDGIDPLAAAAVGVAGKTAWRAVHQVAQVRAEDVVLVLGASGGVGTFAAQLARKTRARVIAHTGSDAKASHLREQDFEVVVAQNGAATAAAVRHSGVTVVLDPLGGDFVASLLAVVQPAARIVTYGTLAGRETSFNLGTLYGKGIRIQGISGGTTQPDEAAAARAGVLEALVRGDLTIEVDVLPLPDALDAFHRLTARRVEGKLVLQP